MIDLVAFAFAFAFAFAWERGEHLDTFSVDFSGSGDCSFPSFDIIVTVCCTVVLTA